MTTTESDYETRIQRRIDEIENRPDPSTMTLESLQSEWGEAWSEATETTVDGRVSEVLMERAHEIGFVLRRRVGLHEPECPHCGAVHWGQEPGDALVCVDCWKAPDDETRAKVHYEWRRMAGETGVSGGE